MPVRNHNSENHPVKNFYRANFDVHNTLLDVDKDLLLGGSDIITCYNSMVYEAIEENVSYVQRFRSSTCPQNYII